MKKFALVLSAVLLMGAALIVKKVSEYPLVTTPGTNDLFLLALTATNNAIKYSDLKAAINLTNQPASTNLTNWSALATSAKQPASANLTNWSALATSAKQDTLGYTPQPASANLTNWSALATSSKQDALGYIPQPASANLTNWSALATSAKQDKGSVNGTNATPLNFVDTATVTWNLSSSSNLTATAVSSGGSSGSTNYRSAVIALTMTGTNVDASQIDWSLTNVCYRLTLTTNAFFGDTVCTNTPGTNFFQWLQLNLVQDATGGKIVTFTNSIFAGVNGTFAITTNGNAWDSLTLINSPQTNGNVAVLPSNFLHR
jgi:hypothetical protein